ncbi:MAG TPA: ABC transporter ATP-binding protein [Actinomycetales bacterium]|nr:ABC transporter ATP-binding protein [Actinomycetales bacterium]
MPPALEVSDLVKTYAVRRRDPVRAADSVTFRALPGEITAVLGPNGAGKTTTLEVCAGLRDADSGAVTVLGVDRLRATAAQSAQLREKVGVMVQAGGLPQAPRAREVLTHVSRLYHSPAPLDSLTEALAIGDVLDRPVRQLSGGEKQRVAVACALLGRPELAFLDEPSSGVDPHARRDTWALLRSQRARGCAVVLTTHHLDEAEQLADHVVIMDAGRVVAAGSVPELTSGYTLTLSADGGSRLGPVIERAAGAHLAALTIHDGGASAVVDRSDAAFLGGVTRELEAAGFGGADVSVARRTLESVFLERTGRTALTAQGGER